MLKIWYNRRGERIQTLLHALNQQGFHSSPEAPRLPAPSFYAPEAHTLVYPRISGVPLTQLLKKGQCRSWVRPLAGALFWLHSRVLNGCPVRSAQDEIDAISNLLSGLPEEWIGPFESAVENLVAFMPLPCNEALLHRDLHDQQLLLGDDCRLVFLDLDDLAWGDPMLDIGNLLAHLHVITHWRRRPAKLERLRARILRGYAAVAGRPVETYATRAAWYESVALTRLAAIQLRRGKPALAPDLLAEARRCLSPSVSDFTRVGQSPTRKAM